MKKTVKKYKLKKGVKVILLLLALFGLFAINSNITKKGIDSCMQEGNSKAFCTYQLERWKNGGIKKCSYTVLFG